MSTIKNRLENTPRHEIVGKKIIPKHIVRRMNEIFLKNIGKSSKLYKEIEKEMILSNLTTPPKRKPSQHH